MPLKKKYRRNHPTRSRKSLLLLIVLAALLASAGAFAYFRSNKPKPVPPSIASDGSYLNLNPPTEEEKQQAEDNKKEIDSQQDPKTPSTENTSDVTVAVVISRLGTLENVVEAGSYVQNVFEDGGTCTYKFTKGSATVSKNTEAFKDARITNCTAVEIPVSEFSSKGTWQLIVTYKSAAHSGTSAAQNVEVQ